MLAGECRVIALKYFINSEYFIMFSCVELHFSLIREQTAALFLELSTLFMVLDPTPFPRITQPMAIIIIKRTKVVFGLIQVIKTAAACAELESLEWKFANIYFVKGVSCSWSLRA